MERAQTLLEQDNVMQEVYDPVAKAAAWERQTHAYVNRTGELNKSTRAEEFALTPNYISIDLVMGGPVAYYARYIAYLKHLSNIDAAAQRAAHGVGVNLRKLGRRIAASG